MRVRHCALLNPSTPPERLDSAWTAIPSGRGSPLPAILPLLPSLGTLAKDDLSPIRAVVACNSQAPPWVLATLVDDEDELVRAGALRHQSVPRYLLHAAGRTHPDRVARRASASNPLCPSPSCVSSRPMPPPRCVARPPYIRSFLPTFRARVSADDEAEVRRAAAHNPRACLRC